MDELLADVQRFLEGKHEPEFNLSYYLGFRDLTDKGYAMWWYAELRFDGGGVSAVEQTPEAAIQNALALAHNPEEVCGR